MMGRSVYVDPTENSGFPSNNTFFHLQAGNGSAPNAGWYQPVGMSASIPAQVYGFMQDNGEPTPQLTSGTLYAPDVAFPVTVSAGTGWSGGTPTLSATYNKNGRVITVVIQASGAVMVIAANATITGLPPNSNAYGLGTLTGVNTAGAGVAIFGYISGSTLVIQSGVSITSSVTFIASYLT
jgi:hypothetical protein